MVMATQNPIEQEGTYPLPEAQLDRFLMKVSVDYPPDADERSILRLVRGEEQEKHGTAAPSAAADPAARGLRRPRRASRMTVVGCHRRLRRRPCLRHARRRRAGKGPRRGWIEVGASPRATIALDRASRAHAWLAGQDHVTPENVRAVAPDVLRHRLILSYEAAAARVATDLAVERLLSLVAVA